MRRAMQLALVVCLGLLAGLLTAGVVGSSSGDSADPRLDPDYLAELPIAYLPGADVPPVGTPVADRFGNIVRNDRGQIALVDDVKAEPVVARISAQTERENPSPQTTDIFVDEEGNDVVVVPTKPGVRMADHIDELDKAGAVIWVDPGDPRALVHCTARSLANQTCSMLQTTAEYAAARCDDIRLAQRAGWSKEDQQRLESALSFYGDGATSCLHELRAAGQKLVGE